jgi:hypothetical protein
MATQSSRSGLTRADVRPVQYAPAVPRRVSGHARCNCERNRSLRPSRDAAGNRRVSRSSDATRGGLELKARWHREWEPLRCAGRAIEGWRKRRTSISSSHWRSICGGWWRGGRNARERRHAARALLPILHLHLSLQAPPDIRPFRQQHPDRRHFDSCNQPDRLPDQEVRRNSAPGRSAAVRSFLSSRL